ncbi:MAG: substrate-binding domain-containing protein [bacterium]|nr:substrate-binding domain-containing protein [Candidatus Colisoma equi]
MEIKYRKVLETLKSEILRGKYSSSSVFPSRAMLIRRFGISNLTAVKVVSKLKDDGFVRSYQGSGTFVTRTANSHKIGLIVPGVAYSDFYAPIVGEISGLSLYEGYTLLLGDASSTDEKKRAAQAHQFVDRLLKENVAGVIFQPFDISSQKDHINAEIESKFKKAGVPVVLLDCDVCFPSSRSKLDVVGIDNYWAGYRIAEHLISVGARNIHFLMNAKRGKNILNYTPSVFLRFQGARAAIESGLGQCQQNVLNARYDNVDAIRRHIVRFAPDAFVCGNDNHALRLIKTLQGLGYKVPGDIRVTGFDDIKMSSLMTPSLTTVHQPCSEIACAAFRRLLARIADPELPPETISLNVELVLRESTAVSSNVSPVKKGARCK